jgi:hypothetical protein
MNDGSSLRDAGVTTVTRNTPQWWKDACDRAIATLAARGVDFTAEDVRAVVGDPPAHPNAMGARFLAAVKDGLIVKQGYKSPARRSSHASVIAIWRGV